MSGQTSPPLLKELISKTNQWGYNTGPNTAPSTPSIATTAEFNPQFPYNKNNGSVTGPYYASKTFRKNLDDKPHSISLPSLVEVDMRPDPCYDQNRQHQQIMNGCHGVRNYTQASPDETDPEVTCDTPLKTIWTDLAKESTCHGVKNVVDVERPRWMRVAWMLIVLTMLSILFINVVVLLYGYYNDHSTVTRTNVTIQSQADFPSVTICNNSPFKNLNGTLDNPMVTMMANQTIIRGYNLLDNISSPEVKEFLSKPLVEVYESYSFSKSDLILLASYEQNDMDIDAAFETKDTLSGRCFTFNGPKYIAKHGVRKANFEGRKSGLRVFLDIKQDMYVPFDGLTAGIHLFVRHHPETPHFESDCMDIQPGTSTSVALQPVKFKFLPYPFTSFGSESCVNVKEGDLMDKMVQAPFYSHHECMLQCQMLRAFNICGCYIPALYPYDQVTNYYLTYQREALLKNVQIDHLVTPPLQFGTRFHNFLGPPEARDQPNRDIKSLPPCRFKDYIDCVDQKFDEIKSGGINVSCDCPRPCTFTQYTSTISSSQIMSSPAIPYFRQRFNVLGSSSENIRENYIEVRVYLETMLMRTESHEPALTPASILGFLGGHMGFFVGASLVTIAELGETLIFTVIHFIHKLHAMGKMPKSVNK